MPHPNTGIVLSGGGARGAYEVGVLLGLRDVLRVKGAIFDIMSGSSVGAIHAGWLAANAHKPGHLPDELAQQWLNLEFDEAVVPSFQGLAAFGRAIWKRTTTPGSLLKAKIFEDLVSHRIAWDDVAHNVESGRVRALIVSALRLSDGVTVLFESLAPGVVTSASRDPRRTVQQVAIGPEEVLASAAIPFLFPLRHVQGELYCDGGLRFNTPISPALRAGAERLVVVPLLHRRPPREVPEHLNTMSPFFLLGKLLNAALLDPVTHDLQVLERFNRLVDTMKDALTTEQRLQLEQTLRSTRGIPYRSVPTLVFRPSRDVGAHAVEFARKHQGSRTVTRAILRLARTGSDTEGDLLSLLLFDGAFAEVLIDLGRRDVLRRRDDVLRFFDA